MILCKHCGGEECVKNGLIKGKQRYLCRACVKTFRLGDAREKYSLEKRIKVIKLYTERMGLRSIERIENISTPLLINWIRNFGKTIRERLCSTIVSDDVKEIEILEVDELFTYYQKKDKKSMCGLLWTDQGIKLLILE